jgi:hypothetical protein
MFYTGQKIYRWRRSPPKPSLPSISEERFVLSAAEFDRFRGAEAQVFRASDAYNDRKGILDRRTPIILVWKAGDRYVLSN